MLDVVKNLEKQATDFGALKQAASPDNTATKAEQQADEKYLSVTAGFYGAKTLLDTPLPPITWIIPNVLPAGLAILGSKSGVGKSWMALDMACEIARGGQFWEHELRQGKALVLALEDHKRRIKERLQKMGHKPTNDLVIAHDFPCFLDGGTDILQRFIEENPSVRFVVIDTLGRLAPAPKRGSDQYIDTVRYLAPLQRIAHENDMAILLIHHLAKLEYLDPTDNLLGSTALSGTADTKLILKKVHSNSKLETTLNIIGKDVYPQRLALHFDKETCRWKCNGEAFKVLNSDNRGEILDALRLYGTMTPKAIAEQTEIKYNTVKSLCKRMAKDGELRKTDKGAYSAT